MNPWLMILVMIIVWGIFALQITVKFGALTKMAPENRFNDIGRRIGRLFKTGFGQEKLIGRSRERGAGIMHAFIFWGALLIGVRELTLMGEGFVSGFQEYLPIKPPRPMTGMYIGCIMLQRINMIEGKDVLNFDAPA